MNEPVTEKDFLILMLTEMNEQLKKLDFALEASFSDLRCRMYSEQEKKLAVCRKRVSFLENDTDKLYLPKQGELTGYLSDHNQTSGLKLKLGFH